MWLEPRTPGLQVKYFTTEPRRTYKYGLCTKGNKSKKAEAFLIDPLHANSELLKQSALLLSAATYIFCHVNIEQSDP